ncbi:hypothetical protein L873DRAFT_1790652 [Choiromyces venosus 120613-1]|uniref:Uncharacterized protein n=1 Tax=Choiromyces venosus 120613-1 TaxID=1336337 RepID=A0A3N4JMG3_9PEZI|nr:hypothetical protein L873DRAFT_1790652 [Choiromyces venosus 120613-1]
MGTLGMPTDYSGRSLANRAGFEIPYRKNSLDPLPSQRLLSRAGQQICEYQARLTQAILSGDGGDTRRSRDGGFNEFLRKGTVAQSAGNSEYEYSRTPLSRMAKFSEFHPHCQRIVCDPSKRARMQMARKAAPSNATKPLQSHLAITNAKSSGFFVRYREVLNEIPYSENRLYGSRGVNSQRTPSSPPQSQPRMSSGVKTFRVSYGLERNTISSLRLLYSALSVFKLSLSLVGTQEGKAGN